jgi:hypothetical protein
VKGKLHCPPDMTIVLVHNREYEPIMERSLRYVGIEEYVALRVQLERQWRHTFKLVTLLHYLDSGSCETEYLFYCDADDVVLRDDPQKAIRYLRESNCDWLFSFDEFSEGYQCMPQVKAWADQKAEESGYPRRYPNSGVWIARRSFVHEVLRVAAAYITDHDLTVTERRRLVAAGTLCQKLPDFPKGVGSDQMLLRYLHPRFYPGIKVDYEGNLSLPRWAPSMPHGW